MKSPTRDTTMASPSILKKKSAFPRRRSSKTMTPKELRNSFSSLTDINESSIQNINDAVNRKSDHAKEIHIHWKRNSSLVMQKRISKIRMSFVDDMFYTEDEIADFRYDKFMEDCGLDPNDFE